LPHQSQESEGDNAYFLLLTRTIEGLLVTFVMQLRMLNCD